MGTNSETHSQTLGRERPVQIRWFQEIYSQSSGNLIEEEAEGCESQMVQRTAGEEAPSIQLSNLMLTQRLKEQARGLHRTVPGP